MCLAVYIASSRPLPAIAWDRKSPAFHLKAVDIRNSVRRQFAPPHVYYAGSARGCGCGFIKDGLTAEEFGPCQDNYAALARTLREALADGASLELFVCWEGGQEKPPVSTCTITPSQLEQPAFELQEQTFLRIRDDSHPTPR